MSTSNLYEYYTHEIADFEQQCKAFGQKHPHAAGALTLDPELINSPTTSHLIQTIALNNAQLKYHFSQLQTQSLRALICQMYPTFSRPLPATALIQFEPAADLDTTHTIESGTLLESFTPEKQRCCFQTTQDITVLPLKCDDVHIDRYPNKVGQANTCLTLSLSTLADELMFSDLGLDHLKSYFQGQSAQALYAALFCDTVAIGIHCNGTEYFLKPEQLTSIAIDSILNKKGPQHTIAAYDLLMAYAHFPEQFLGFQLNDLNETLKHCTSNHIKLNFYLKKHTIPLATNSLTPANFIFNATPIVNLFEKDSSPITIDNKTTEYQLVSDTRIPEHYDLNSVISVKSIDQTGKSQTLNSLYQESNKDQSQFYIRHDLDSDNHNVLWISLSHAEKLHGQTLIATTYCTNGQNAVALTHDMSHPSKIQGTSSLGPIEDIHWVTPLTQQKQPLIHKMDTVKLLNLLMSHQHSLIENNGRGLIEVVRQLLEALDSPYREMLSHIKKIETHTLYRRQTGMPIGSAVPFLQMHIVIDDQNIDLSRFVLLSQIVDAFMAARSHINTLTQTCIDSNTQTKELWQWPIKCGMQQMI